MQQLEEIHQQIIDFANRVSILQKDNAGLCDANLNLPAWRSVDLNQPERFVTTAVLGNVGRFSVHFQLLQNSQSVINESKNKETLTILSGAILKQVQLYAQKAINKDDKTFSGALAKLLESADKAIQAYSGPSASPQVKR